MKTRIRGFEMVYEDEGSGTPIVLIHGYPLNRTLWEPQVNDLAAVARIIAPDLRGHGESQVVEGPYPMEALAEDIAALLDALGLERAVIGGLSMGGYVTLAFFRKYPARVRALILANTRAGTDTPEGRKARDDAVAKAQTEGAEAIGEAMLPKMLSPKTLASKPDVVARVQRMMASTSVAGVVGDLLGMKVRADSTSLLAKIQVPTLVICGADDALIPPGESEAMHAAIKNSRLVRVPEAGHLVSLEQPDLFNAAVREFL